MIIKKRKGQVCFRCGEFSKVFVQCECCRKSMCKKCALNSYYCIDCYNIKINKQEVKDYFEEKYAEKVGSLI